MVICAGKVETFTAPKTGNYKLECWGAGVDGMDAYGGYSVGEILLNPQNILYVCVGGKGSLFSGTSGGKGGYNGGGDGGNGYIPKNWNGGTGGGGATHIATQTGLLKELENDYKTKLLLVAGGSGGNCGWSNYEAVVKRVFGGGTEAGAPYNLVTGARGTKATQTQGWAFGQGQQGRNATTHSEGGEGNGGGGGGFRGGYAPQNQGGKTNCAGGGGSGYVNSTLLSNAQTIAGNLNFPSPDGSTETGHTGDGACIITQLSFN